MLCSRFVCKPVFFRKALALLSFYVKQQNDKIKFVRIISASNVLFILLISNYDCFLVLNKTKIKNLFCDLIFLEVKFSSNAFNSRLESSFFFYVDKTINSRLELIYTLIYTIAAVSTVKMQFENVSKQTWNRTNFTRFLIIFNACFHSHAISMLSELFRCVQCGSSNLYLYFNKVFELNKGGIHSLLLLSPGTWVLW